MNNLGLFLLERCTADGIGVLAGFTWFPHALVIAEKEKEERAILRITRISWGHVDGRDSRRQIYERRFVDANKRWIETWFDESYKPPPEPVAPKA